MMNDIIANPRSHYRYNWQWDYVQKYAEAHHKNLLQVFVLDQASLSFLMDTFPGLPGREGDGAGEGEQVEGRGDQGRGGQEGGGEEARGGGAREEARQGRNPRQV